MNRVTREEAIINVGTLKTVIKDIPKYNGEAIDDSLEMAIKALEQESCKDAISRAEALKVVDDMDIPEDMSTFEIKGHICVRISTLPPAQPKSETGHWITKPHVYGVTYCSECGFELKIDNTKYWR